MKTKDYTTSFTVDQSPEEVFDSINDVRGWWSEEIDGSTDKLGAEFKYHYKDIHCCAFKITEFAPGKKVVWHILDNTLTLLRTRASGREQTLSLKLRRRMAKQKFTFTLRASAGIRMLRCLLGRMGFVHNR